jgi:hypothetical protein
MPPPIPHDPLLKQTVRDRLYALLYTPADTRMFDRLKDIVMANAVLVKAAHASFMYKAVNYSCDASPILPRPRNQLHASLEGRMREYLADKERLENEKPMVTAYLTQVLNASDHPGDWLKLLIPALHQPVQAAQSEHPSLLASKRIDDEAVEAFLVRNKAYISMTKQRLVTNLITS